jgi:hypothetical protein
MMNDLITLAKDVVKRQFITHMPITTPLDLRPDPEVENKLRSKYIDSYSNLLSLQFNVDYSLGLQPANITKIYSEFIAVDETIERVVLNSTIEFRMKADLDDPAWFNLCTTMSQMLYLGHPSSASTGARYAVDQVKYKCTPDEVSSRFTKADSNYSAMVCNPWLVICILLSYAPPIDVDMQRVDRGRGSRSPGNE